MSDETAMPVAPKEVTTTTSTVTSVDEPSGGDSSLWGVSLRAWLAVILTGTVCAMSVMQKDVIEPLYTLSIMAISFYFGQKSAKR